MEEVDHSSAQSTTSFTFSSTVSYVCLSTAQMLCHFDSRHRPAMHLPVSGKIPPPFKQPKHQLLFLSAWLFPALPTSERLLDILHPLRRNTPDSVFRASCHQKLTLAWWYGQSVPTAFLQVKKSAVGFLAASWLILPIARNLTAPLLRRERKETGHGNRHTRFAKRGSVPGRARDGTVTVLKHHLSLKETPGSACTTSA